ncbi:MAG: isoprenylcysteine carboxylmethyltransferase family protein [Pseudomonadota bacterium]|nr:isoprenylcysteine carboxylmethyltransferase family protein [Pseudomonadota bacterium]
MALAAIIVFIVFVLIGRIVFHYKLTGTSGIKFNLKSLSSCSFSAYSILVSVGWWGIVLLSILEFFDKFHPQFNFGITGIIIGFAFVLSGIFIANVSQYQMGKSWRYIGSKSDDAELITHGLFKYCRNPIYLGGLIFFDGILILLPHYLTLICVISIYIGIEILIRYEEEPHLRKIHGRIYEEYCNKVRRFMFY